MSSSLFADCYLDYSADPKPAREKYCIYAKDRKRGYLVPVYESEDRSKVVLKINQIASGKFHSKWAKCYRHSAYLGPVTNGVYKDYKEFDIPFVQLTVTKGECNWHNAVELIYDIDNKKMYFDTDKTNLTYILNPEGKVDIKLKKEWNSKLAFRRK